MIRAIGIDLGTTNTVASQMKKGEPREIHNRLGKYSTPSAVAISRKGELLVGEDALSRGSGVACSFKRHIGTDKKIEFNNRLYSPMELSALILRQVKKDVEDVLGEPVPRAVITVPAWFSERAIVETREAGRLAGFFVLRTFSEPMAAASAYGIDREDTDPKTLLVYDLGGGTFDISVLMVTPGNFAALDHEGDVLLGGDDFDDNIINYIRESVRKGEGIEIPDDEATKLKLKVAAEKAKIDLSRMDSVVIALPSLGKEGISVELELTRQQLEPMLMPWLVGPLRDNRKSTLELSREAIDKSHLTLDTIDNVLLVGGSTYIPQVRQILAEEFGEEKILKAVNPMLCVAHGAAIETSLVGEVKCLECQYKNSLEAMQCEQCGTPLIGEEKIDCPHCFMPSPATEKLCWKCGEELRADKGAVPPASLKLTKKCPEGHENPLDAPACQVCGQAFEAGGIKCRNCQHINKEGVTKCEKCGALLPTRDEITAKDKGIELADGRFSVIVPKGTPYPTTSSPRHKTYSTPQANAQRMEITVYEGDNPLARENEWQGELVLGLPPGLSKGTLVDISINVDNDSSMEVSAKLIDQPLTAVSARIERTKGGGEMAQELEGLMKKARDIDKKGKDNLGEDKRKELQEMINELEDAKQKGDSRRVESRRDQWEKQIADYEADAEVRSDIAYIIGRAEITLKVADFYLSPENREKLSELIKEAKKAFSSGDLTAAKRSCDQLRQTLESLGGVNLIVNAEMVAGQRGLSPSTSSQIYKNIEELKNAAHSGDQAAVERIMHELDELVNKAIEEITTTTGTSPIVKPDEV